MKSIINNVLRSVMAGFLIGFAGWIYLQCDNKIVGSALFSIGLIAVILLQANLFTGKVGYIDTKRKLLDAVIILIINIAVAYLVGLVYRYAVRLGSFQSRLDKAWYRLLLDGFGCGVLIYLAVELYNKTKNVFLVVLPVVCFILAGMEHSIADAFYFGTTEFSWLGLADLGLVVLGNSLGSLSMHGLQKLYETAKL